MRHRASPRGGRFGSYPQCEQKGQLIVRRSRPEGRETIGPAKWWNDVPRGTMDEVSSHVRLDLPLLDGKAAGKIVPPRLRIP